MKIAIVGSGIVGRLMTWHLCQHHEVHIFTKGSIHSEDACSSIAAGMISPFAELPLLPLEWHGMGVKALKFWQALLACLPAKINHNTAGTLVVSMGRHKALLTHFIQQLKVKKPEIDLALLSESEIQLLEPELKGYCGICLPEIQIEPKSLFAALNIATGQEELDDRLQCRRRAKILSGLHGQGSDGD